MGSCISHESSSNTRIRTNTPRLRITNNAFNSANDLVGSLNAQSTQTLAITNTNRNRHNNKSLNNNNNNRQRTKLSANCLLNATNCTNDTISEDLQSNDFSINDNGLLDNANNSHLSDDDSVISFNRRFRNVNEIVTDILNAIRTIVINNTEDDTPTIITELHIMASDEKSWIKILLTLIKRVKLNDPLGPAIIALFLEECPLPSKDSILLLLRKLPIWKSNVHRNEERNSFVVFSCLSEKISGPYSSLMLNKDTLDYIFSKFKNISRFSTSNLTKDNLDELTVILFALIALEKFAISTENRLKIMEYLTKNMNPLVEFSHWNADKNYLKRQIGFNALFLLDNAFTTPDHIYGYKTVNIEGINAKLNDNDVSEYLKISPNGLEARNDTLSFESVRCTFQVDTDIWYYEVTVLTNGIMQIGFATKASKFLNYNGYGIGDDEYSIAYDGCRRLIWYNADSSPHEHKAWKEGDVVGLLLNLNNNQVIFYLNGTPLSSPHKKIFTKVRTGFFAAASFMSFQHCIFNFGREPFKYPPKEYKFKTFNDFGILNENEKIVLPRKMKLEFLRDSVITEGACSLCYDNLATVVLEPCMHKDFCNECAQRLTKCPVCRSDIALIKNL